LVVLKGKENQNLSSIPTDGDDTGFAKILDASKISKNV
jgi:hypothetical protein